MSVIYGVDVGGSGIKGAPVDLELGALTKRRTDQDAEAVAPEAVFDVIEELLDAEAWNGPLGVAIPAVVAGGVAKTAANIDDASIRTDAPACFHNAATGWWSSSTTQTPQALPRCDTAPAAIRTGW